MAIQFYSTWKFHISNLLQKNDLLDVLEPNHANGVGISKGGKTLVDFECWKKKTLANKQDFNE